MSYLTKRRLLELDARLTERDREVATVVEQLRLVSGTQLARLFFAHHGLAPARARLARGALARLTELRVLSRLDRVIGGARSGSGAWVYEVGPAGERLLAYWRGEGLGRTRPAHEPGQRFVAHTLAVAETSVRIREAEREGRFEVVDFQAEPECWRRSVGLGGRQDVLKPDAFVWLAQGEFLDAWWLEIDLGTESSRVLKRQCLAYARHFQTGREQHERGVFPKVLWVVPGRARGELLARVIKELPEVVRELFTITTDAPLIEILAAGAGGLEATS